MGVYALTSVTGSPGVTTTALAWASLSPRPTLIVEADVTGGSPILAGAFDGTMLHRGSVLALASAETEDWVETIWRNAVPLPDRVDRWVLPAIGRGHQARAMAPLWRSLATTLSGISTDTGVDVLVDVGRLGVAGGAWDLVESADAVLVLTDSTIPALTSLAIALDSLRADLSTSGSPQRLGIVPIVGPSQILRPWAWLGRDTEPDIRPYSRPEIAATFAPTPALAALPHAPRAAAAYMHARPTTRDGSGYNAAVRALITAAEQHARDYAALLDPQETTDAPAD